MKIIQITDLHLFTNDNTKLAGVPTTESLIDVLELIGKNESQVDYIMITGDIAQDELQSTYEKLKQLLGPLINNCFFVPGNHDNIDFMFSVFEGKFVPRVPGLNSFVEHSDGIVVGLDTQVQGETYGRLREAQISWLTLHLESKRDVLVFMHHPPIPVNAMYMDRIRLQEEEPLRKLAEKFANLRGIFSGHVHMAHSGYLGPCPVYTTPATCVQLAKEMELTHDPVQPGYRRIELVNGELSTMVMRLQEAKYKYIKEAW